MFQFTVGCHFNVSSCSKIVLMVQSCVAVAHLCSVLSVEVYIISEMLRPFLVYLWW